jgi:16S rRNA (guanine527-N7)-methyltransferase
VIVQILRRGAAELGLNLTERQYEQFEAYYRLLVEWNARFNLTAVTEYDAAQSVHFLDSLSLIKSGVDFDGNKIIDVGAGAGFPGLPLKIAFPDIRLTLLEATGKKAVFLSEVAAALELSDVAVLNARAEDAAWQPEQRDRYDIAVSRAVASLDTLCELSLPFCRVGGKFVAMKKGQIQDEVEVAAKAIAALRGRLLGVRDVSLSDLSGDRKLVIIEKIGQTPAEYPRHNGVAAKKPIR